MAEVSICIATWNGKNILKECLESIYKSLGTFEYEVIVVDNGSEDGTKEMLIDHYPGVVLIINEENLGFTKAYNQAIKRANGKYIFLLNNDIILQEQTAQKLVDYLRDNEQVGIVGCKLILPNGKLQYTCHHFPTPMEVFSNSIFLNRIFPGSQIFGRTNMTYWDYDETREVDWIAAAAIMVRKKALKDVGLLDEKIFAFGEDRDWCYRFWKKNWKVVYVANAKAKHRHGSSSMNYQGDGACRVIRDNILRVGASKIYFFNKFKPKTEKYVIFFQFLFAFSRTILYAIKALITWSERDFCHALGYFDRLICSRDDLFDRGLR